MLLRFALSVAIACPLLAQSVKIQFDPVSQAVIKARLDRAPASNGERAAALHKMFDEAKCSGAMIADQEVKGGRQPNVICTSEGQSPSTIIVGAHIDFTEVGQGAVENWTGASLLPSLFESLHDTPRKHKFVFVGFADREKGRRGSSYYVKNLSDAEKSQIKAMVNVEGLGLSSTKVQLDGCDRSLSQKMAAIAKSLNLKVAGANDPVVAESDQLSFFEAKIPVISIHSIYGPNKKVPGTMLDKPGAVSMTDYYESYRLIAAYLVYLDQVLD